MATDTYTTKQDVTSRMRRTNCPTLQAAALQLFWRAMEACAARFRWTMSCGECFLKVDVPFASA